MAGLIEGSDAPSAPLRVIARSIEQMIAEYTKEDATRAISEFKASKKNFLDAVKTIKESLPNETHTLESFGHNSNSFYQAVESILGLVNKASTLLEGMDSSIATLTFRGEK